MRKNTRVICGGILSKKIYIFLRWKGVLGIRNKSIENIINLPVELCRDVSCERIAVNFFVARFLLIVRLERYGWEEGEKGFSSLSPVLIIEDPIYRLFFTGSVLAPPSVLWIVEIHGEYSGVGVPLFWRRIPTIRTRSFQVLGKF